MYKLTKICQSETREIEFKISPSNVYIDFENNIKILQRRILLENEGQEKEKLKELKALLGFLIYSKDYDKLMNTNNKELKVQKEIAKIINSNTIEEMKSNLEEYIREEKKDFERNKKVVDRTKYSRLKRNKLSYRIAVAALLIFCTFQVFYIGTFKNKELEASQAYIESDYSTVLEVLVNENINRLNKEDKYIYALSTINTQSQLTSDQKEQLKSLIDIQVDEDILNYWVYIGQGNYEEANNMGIKVNDADMQIYALMLLINETQNDENLEAEERQSQVSTYEGQIEALNKAKEELNEEEAKETIASGETVVDEETTK